MQGAGCRVQGAGVGENNKSAINKGAEGLKKVSGERFSRSSTV